MGFFQSGGILNRRGFFGGAAKTFSPADISGLQLWLDATTGLFDATSGGSAVTTDGSAVARWEDQSGNGRHFKQTTSNNRPTLKTSIQNNRNVIQFDAVNDFLQMDTVFSGLTSACYFIVLKITNDPPTNQFKTGHPIFFLYGATNQADSGSHYTWTDSNIYDFTMTTTRKAVGNPSANLTNFNLYNVESGSSIWTARLNKTQLFTTSTNTFSQNGTILGKSENPNNVYYFDGSIAELVAYNSIIDSSARTRVEDYLYAKWAIT